MSLFGHLYQGVFGLCHADILTPNLDFVQVSNCCNRDNTSFLNILTSHISIISNISTISNISRISNISTIPHISSIYHISTISYLNISHLNNISAISCILTISHILTISEISMIVKHFNSLQLQQYISWLNDVTIIFHRFSRISWKVWAS